MIYAFSQAIDYFDNEKEQDTHKMQVSIDVVENFYHGYFYSLLSNLMSEEDIFKIVGYMTLNFVEKVKSNTNLKNGTDIDRISWAIQII